MTKQMPKSTGGDFVVSWFETHYQTGMSRQVIKDYPTQAEADAALAIALTHKTKRKAQVHERVRIPCTDTREEQFAQARVGGTWDSIAGCYMYSASY